MGNLGSVREKTIRARVKKIPENSISVKNGGREATDRHCLGKDKEVCEKSEASIAAEGICDMSIVLSYTAENSRRKKIGKG